MANMWSIIKDRSAVSDLYFFAKRFNLRSNGSVAITLKLIEQVLCRFEFFLTLLV